MTWLEPALPGPSRRRIRTTPLELNPLELVTEGAPAVGDLMTITRYGHDSYDEVAKQERGSGSKREGTVKVDRVTSFTIEVKRAPHIGCFGDSGGPLLDEARRVYASTRACRHRVAARCKTRRGPTRVW